MKTKNIHLRNYKPLHQQFVIDVYNCLLQIITLICDITRQTSQIQVGVYQL